MPVNPLVPLLAAVPLHGHGQQPDHGQIQKPAFSHRMDMASVLTAQLAVALEYGGLPCLVTGTATAFWPTRDMMRPGNRSPPPMALRFRVERGEENRR